MFSSALKSFTSNISANYQISSHPSFISGPWKVFWGKKKSTGTAASIFIFDRKSLDSRGNSLGPRHSSSQLKRLHEEVTERLRLEASNLARLRHPSVLQVLEPVEETRSGGLMFATEPVTASLSGLLRERDDQERTSRLGGRSRFMVEDENGTSGRRDLEIDEIEIQKGLLQVAKGLEFLHESAGLVHGNLNPDCIYVNVKSDWKISGLAFAGPADNASYSSLPPLALSEVLYHDPRLPRSVQLDLDYSSPDFVIDSNVSPAADLFSLGLVIVALYNSPHASPLQSHGNTSTYKKLLASPSTIPSQQNQFLSSRPIPKALASQVLPRLITRQAAQRMNAKEFQESSYFDNILVSTIRFLESLPTKTMNEKSQFMRGLQRILPEFPTSVSERKLLPALLEETKDKELLSLILQNIFKIIKTLPSAQKIVLDKVVPQLKAIFATPGGKVPAAGERDTHRDASLMVVFQNMKLLADNCSGRIFKEDVLPLVRLGLDCPTHSVVDAAMQCLPAILPILDFTTVKDEVFPPIASVFAKTNSLMIKVRGLEAFVVLCGGGSEDSEPVDDLSGIPAEARSSKPHSSILDKYTIQEKLVPLVKAIRTKEPAVMMASLNVFRFIGKSVDTDFLALEVLPILWSFSLGPLLNVQQFGRFMELIKSLSKRVEVEQTKKLQALSLSNDPSSGRASLRLGRTNNAGQDDPENVTSDFERLVLGRSTSTETIDDPWGDWDSAPAPKQSSVSAFDSSETPKLSWSSNSITTNTPAPMRPSLSSLSSMNSRSVTPDTAAKSFPSLTPLAPLAPSANKSAPLTGNMAPMQPQTWQSTPMSSPMSSQMNSSVARNSPLSSFAAPSTQNTATVFSMPPLPPPAPAPAQTPALTPSVPGMSFGQTAKNQSMNSLWPSSGGGGSTLTNRPLNPTPLVNQPMKPTPAPPILSPPPQPPASQKQGLDKYESLL